MNNGAITRAFPLLFVAIWASGFMVARLVAPYAQPFTFLSARFVLSAAVFAALASAAGAKWPDTWRGWGNAFVTGVLMQGMFLGGVFWSVRHGLPAGIAALVGGLQPLMTASLAGLLLGETVGARRWLGIFIGFAGAALVLLPRLGVASAGAIALVPLGVCFAGVVGMTLGTIWQKRTGTKIDLRAGAAVQFVGAALVAVPVAILTESVSFDWAWQAWAGLLWAVIGLSVGAISLLLLLIRRGAVSSVASLFYLVPPAAAVLAFAAFGEDLSLLQIIGIALAAIGVAVAGR